MIAKQTLFLNEDRSRVVPEGHADAKFLLVREGNEIDDALVEKHGVADLVNKAAKTSAKPEAAPPPEAPAPTHREEEMPPLHKRGKKKPKK